MGTRCPWGWLPGDGFSQLNKKLRQARRRDHDRRPFTEVQPPGGREALSEAHPRHGIHVRGRRGELPSIEGHIGRLVACHIERGVGNKDWNERPAKLIGRAYRDPAPSPLRVRVSTQDEATNVTL